MNRVRDEGLAVRLSFYLLAFYLSQLPAFVHRL